MRAGAFDGVEAFAVVGAGNAALKNCTPRTGAFSFGPSPPV